jgi:hypothetical protein
MITPFHATEQEYERTGTFDFRRMVDEPESDGGVELVTEEGLIWIA